MNYVIKITNGMFMVSSEMADVCYIVWLDDADDMAIAMKVAKEYFEKWLTTDDYSEQTQGYIGIVRDRLFKTGIEAKFFDEITEFDK